MDLKEISSPSFFILCGWLLSLVLSGLAASGTFVVWLFLKSPKSRAFGTAVIVTATIFMVFAASGKFITDYARSRHELSRLKDLGQGISYHAAVDLVGSDMIRSQESEAFVQKYPASALLRDLFGLPAAALAVERGDKGLRSLPASAFSEPGVYLKRAIFFRHFGKPFPQDTDCKLLDYDLAYWVKAGYPTGGAKRFEDRRAALDEALSDGWYKATAMAEFYKSYGKELPSAEIARNAAFAAETFRRMLLYFASKLVFALFGSVIILALLVNFKRLRARVLPITPVAAASLRQVYCCLLATFYIEFFAGLVIALVRIRLGQPLDGAGSHGLFELCTALCSFGAMLLSIKVVILRPLSLSYSSAFNASTGISWRQSLVYGLAAYLVLLFLNCLYLVVLSLFHSHQTTNNGLALKMWDAVTTGDQLSYISIWLSAAVIGPVGEELFCRGVLFSSLKSKFGFPIAAVASAAIFSLVHLDPGTSISIFAIGFGLAVLYQLTGSLRACIITHFLWNSTAFLAYYLLR